MPMSERDEFVGRCVDLARRHNRMVIMARKASREAGAGNWRDAGSWPREARNWHMAQARAYKPFSW
ncbi:hypothetical protein DDSR119_43 [Pseudomonas phage DDSR119]|nr:hypothetical protein DDSR119_43 [Pseudomonas phage DDSR119]